MLSSAAAAASAAVLALAEKGTAVIRDARRVPLEDGVGE
jgi:hypothetical protein